MKPFLVLYATREGHARKVAEYVVERIDSRGSSADIFDAAHLPPDLPLDRYSGAIIIASIHRQKHEPEITKFLRGRATELARLRSALLSISLSQAGAEDPGVPAHRREEAAANAQKMIDAFLEEASWRPSKTKAVAGALVYSKYNFLIRLIMKRIVARQGGDTDTSRDYEYTDWNALDGFVDDFLADNGGSETSVR